MKTIILCVVLSLAACGGTAGLAEAEAEDEVSGTGPGPTPALAPCTNTSPYDPPAEPNLIVESMATPIQREGGWDLVVRIKNVGCASAAAMDPALTVRGMMTSSVDYPPALVSVSQTEEVEYKWAPSTRAIAPQHTAELRLHVSNLLEDYEAEVDPEDQVDESNEGDNILSYVP